MRKFFLNIFFVILNPAHAATLIIPCADLYLGMNARYIEKRFEEWLESEDFWTNLQPPGTNGLDDATFFNIRRYVTERDLNIYSGALRNYLTSNSVKFDEDKERFGTSTRFLIHPIEGAGGLNGFAGEIKERFEADVYFSPARTLDHENAGLELQELFSIPKMFISLNAVLRKAPTSSELHEMIHASFYIHRVLGLASSLSTSAQAKGGIGSDGAYDSFISFEELLAWSVGESNSIREFAKGNARQSIDQLREGVESWNNVTLNLLDSSEQILKYLQSTKRGHFQMNPVEYVVEFRTRTKVYRIPLNQRQLDKLESLNKDERPELMREIAILTFKKLVSASRVFSSRSQQAKKILSKEPLDKESLRQLVNELELFNTKLTLMLLPNFSKPSGLKRVG